MAVDPNPDSEGSRAVAALIDAAAALLPPIPKSFMVALFSRAVPEDFLLYQASEVAALAERAWSLLSTRTPGTAKIRFEAPPPSGERLKDVSVLEIINDDMPFLVDSVMAELADHGVEGRLVVHPVFAVARDAQGRLTDVKGLDIKKESFIHIHAARIDEEGERNVIVAELEQVLADVRVCVQDWRAMLAHLGEVVAEIKQRPPPLPAEEVAEATQFIEWLLANNFTFMGIRHYGVRDDGDVLQLEPQFETGLGVLREPERRVVRRGAQQVTVTPEIRKFLGEPRLLFVTKSAWRSRVHRRVYMDYIGIKRLDAEGRLAGEIRIVGLFTSTAYTRSTRSIPYLRRKVGAVVNRAGFDPDGHSGKALVNVLENYPRDELFQIDEDMLYNFALAILQLDERPRVRVLPRRDRFDRFVSVFVFVPRDRYDSDVRKAIGDYLAQAYHGRVSAFYPFFPEGPLVRVHFIIGAGEGGLPDPDRGTLEAAVGGIVRTWMDGLLEALAAMHPPAKARALAERYRGAFSEGYREACSPMRAVDDIRVIESLSPSRPLGVDFYRRQDGEGVGLKVWSYERPIPLSDRVPVLENMGFRVVDEATHRIARGSTQGPQEPQDEPQDPDVWFHDMVLTRADGGAVDLADARQRLQSTFL